MRVKVMASRYRTFTEMLAGWRAVAAAAGVLGVLALGAGAFAQDEAPAEPADEAPAPASENAPRRPPRNENDVFIPTEEIAADEEVVFPVDI